MEKVLLVMALLGSVYLALRGLVKVGRLLMAFLMPKAIPILPSAVRNLDTTGMAVPNDEVEDWSKYEVPAFIRRGIPMPVLEPASAKPTKTRNWFVIGGIAAVVFLCLCCCLPAIGLIIYSSNAR